MRTYKRAHNKKKRQGGWGGIRREEARERRGIPEWEGESRERRSEGNVVEAIKTNYANQRSPSRTKKPKDLWTRPRRAGLLSSSPSGGYVPRKARLGTDAPRAALACNAGESRREDALHRRGTETRLRLEGFERREGVGLLLRRTEFGALVASRSDDRLADGSGCELGGRRDGEGGQGGSGARRDVGRARGDDRDAVDSCGERITL